MTENIAELWPTVVWKAEFVHDEPVFLAEELSKQNVERPALFLLAASSAVQGERDKLRKDLLNKKKQGLGDMGNSILITKDAKIRRVTLKKACFEEKAKGGVGNSLAGTLKGSEVQVFPHTQGPLKK